ncbi:FMN-binding protein [Promicromonospora sp. NPDC057138]|uniref:FMN-binding protein n=1 Tax=Promicromonospora sp. NPDC057138 TaxID=3346031 RepID=UPI00363B7022
MSRIVYALLATFTGLVLLFGYRTSTEVVTPTALEPQALSPTVQGNSSSGTTSSGGTTSGTSTGLSDGTYQGTTASTRWGPVQVQITVSGGQITDAQALQYPTGNSTDDRINSYAIPVLNGEVLDAQNTQIDMVSGATVTSGGYLDSLQSALDQARG